MCMALPKIQERITDMAKDIWYTPIKPGVRAWQFQPDSAHIPDWVAAAFVSGVFRMQNDKIVVDSYVTLTPVTVEKGDFVILDQHNKYSKLSGRNFLTRYEELPNAEPKA